MMRPEPRVKTLTYSHLKLTYDDIMDIFNIFERSFEFKKLFSPRDCPERGDLFTVREIDAYIRYDAPLKESNSNRIEWRTELSNTIDDAKKNNKKIVYVRIECIQRLNILRYGMHEPIAILELSKDDARLTIIDLNDELVDDVTDSLDTLADRLKEFFSDKQRIVMKYIFWNEGIAAIISAVLIFWIFSGKEFSFFVNSILESMGILIIFVAWVFLMNKIMRQDERVIFVKKWFE